MDDQKEEEMTHNEKSTRYYSGRQEKKVAKAVGGRQVANSGAATFVAGDVITDNFLIECKTKTSASKTMTVHKDWITKNEEEAFAMNKPYSAVVIDFGDGENYYLINEKLFKRLNSYLKGED